MKKRFLITLFFYQFGVSCIFHAFFGFLGFLSIVSADANFAEVCLILGVVVGSYAYGYRQGKKFSDRLDDEVNKLAWYIAGINFTVFAIASIIELTFHLAPNISLNSFYVTTLSLRGLFIFCLYYFGTRILIKQGMKAKHARNSSLLTE